MNLTKILEKRYRAFSSIEVMKCNRLTMAEKLKHFLQIMTFFFVILNYHVQNHPGINVLKFIRSKRATQKVLVLTFAPDENTAEEERSPSAEELKALGAYDVQELPCPPEKIIDIVEGEESLGQLIGKIKIKEGQSEELKVNAPEGDFIPININELFLQKGVYFDVHIKLSQNHFVKILHAGDTFSRDRIDHYRDKKGIKFLYIHKNDMTRYVAYMNQFSTKVIKSNLPSKSKKTILHTTAKSILDDIQSQGLRPQTINASWEVCENIHNYIKKEDKDLWKLFQQLEEIDPNQHDHCFLVSLFSTSIVKQFEWESKTMIETMAFASMFHDIGKLKLPENITSKRPSEMSDNELEQYKKHPIFGAELLEKKINAKKTYHAAKQIILQHHEAYDGSGFPHGIRGSRLLTLSNILCLVDDFTHIMKEKELPPKEALRDILSNQKMLRKYRSSIVENFIRVFADPSKIVASK